MNDQPAASFEPSAVVSSNPSSVLDCDNMKGTAMHLPTLSLFSTEEQRWGAVVRRDPSADGAFLYAVRTTGVYCRPICRSRRPNRKNVEFFPDCAHAERAGFRPCMKCRPKALTPQPAARRAVLRACRMIDEAAEPPALKTLAGAAGLSPAYFQRLFKSIVGVSPRDYAAARRTSRLQGGLAGGGSVTGAILDAGFGSTSPLYTNVARTLGMKPSEFKGGGEGVRIRYAVARSFLGWVVVAATDRGICTIEFGDSPAELRSRLTDRFPRAELQGDDPGFTDQVKRVLRFIAAPGRGLDLPLDIRGTSFQRQVWKALQAIPAGATATYSEIAGRIGRPGAARAVARACASNRLAVAIPCHRIVRSDGAPGGYRWGLARKRALIERESRPGR